MLQKGDICGMIGYCDGDYAGNQDTLKSTTWYLFDYEGPGVIKDNHHYQ